MRSVICFNTMTHLTDYKGIVFFKFHVQEPQQSNMDSFKGTKAPLFEV